MNRLLTQGLFLLALWALLAPAASAQDSGDAITVAAYYFPHWHPHKTLGGKADHPAEWGALQAARPRFAGHDQPKVPAWGYEDESDPKAMAKKIDAAADHGVDVFIFDWYFNAKGTYIEKPLNEAYLKAPNNGRVKFALMWANHDLYGSPGTVTREEFDRMADHVVNDYLTHPSYWKINGRPYFSIYQVRTLIEGLGGLEATRAALDDFERKARAKGLPGIHFNLVDYEIRNVPADASVVSALGASSVTSYVWIHLVALSNFPTMDFRDVGNRYFYMWNARKTGYGVPYFPNASMGWDPTPRMAATDKHDNSGYPDTAVIINNTPEFFRNYLEKAKECAMSLPPDRRVVTINAWNEWTEGSYLEPDTKNGMKYLEAIRDVFGK